MAISVVNAGNVDDETDLTSYSFSVTLVASRWLVIDYASQATATPNTPTVSGGGLTWVSAEVVQAQSNRKIGRAYAWTGATPGAQTISIDYGGQTQTWCAIYPNHIDGADLTDPFVDGNSLGTSAGTGTSGSVTLNAFADSSNRPLAFFWKRVPGEALVAEGGYTELGTQVQNSGDNREMSMWHDSTAETTPSASWTTDIQWAVIASEIKVAGTAAATSIPTVSVNPMRW